MKKLLTFFIALLLLIYFPSRVFADSNFITDYDVTYNVLENALTHVTFDITLTNKTSQYYASSYGIQIGFKNIDNVLARDSGGKINPEVTKNSDGNDINIVFNDRPVGLDKKLNFSISFDTNDIAQKSGKIWDINIPGLTEQKSYNSFNVSVVVPESLGAPSYIKPNSGKLINGNLTFTKEELGESGISVSFGKEQFYDFGLLYHLKNPNLFPVKTEIALPPSTNYQDILISDINPTPQNVTRDADGNWLAQYILSPGKKIDVKVTGQAKINLIPVKDQMPDSELKEYTKEQPYWQTSNAEIKDLALKLKTPYAIYQYIVSSLKYDFNRVEGNQPRIGAAGVLKNPTSAVCLEFTDLFIAIARAADIPAREINGFAFTQNSKERPLSLVKDVLHAWPEYYDYDAQTWIMIDPTWENTTGGVDYFHTLDFDHFAFVIKGVNSNYPVPAGGYKTSDDPSTRDIAVEFGSNFNLQDSKLDLSSDFASSYFSGINPKGNIVITNKGNSLSTPQQLTVTTDFLKPTIQKVNLGPIPPFGFVRIPVSFRRPSILTNKADKLKIAVNENVISKEIKISPFILNLWTIIGGILIVSTAIGISIIIFRPRDLSVPKQEERDTIRR